LFRKLHVILLELLRIRTHVWRPKWLEGLGSSMQNSRSLTKYCYITFLSSRTVSLLSSYTSTSNNILLSCYLDLLWLTKWGINLKSLHPALVTKVFWIIAAKRNKLHWQNITPKMTTNLSLLWKSHWCIFPSFFAFSYFVLTFFLFCSWVLSYFVFTFSCFAHEQGVRHI
jgi:hypothetical protein